MRKQKFVIGALLGVLGALVVSAPAFAGSAQSQSLAVTLSPKKQSPKVFGGVSLHAIIATTYDNFVASASPRQTVFTIPKDVKFVNGNIPGCQLNQIQNKPTAQAQAACPNSITGGGSVEAQQVGGTLHGVVTLFSGGPNTIYVHTAINPNPVLTIIGTIQGKTLTFSNIPNTPGLDLTKFDVTFNKRKTGGKTFYVMARCGKKKKWSTSETTTFYDGKVLSASSSQKCKQKL